MGVGGGLTRISYLLALLFLLGDECGYLRFVFLVAGDSFAHQLSVDNAGLWRGFENAFRVLLGWRGGGGGESGGGGDRETRMGEMRQRTQFVARTLRWEERREGVRKRGLGIVVGMGMQAMEPSLEPEKSFMM